MGPPHWDEAEHLHLLHPQLIAAFRGASGQREDKFFNLQGMYRKKKLIRSDLAGPAEVMLALPAGFFLTPLAVEDSANLLFDFCNLLFYTQGIQMKTVLLNLKHMVAARDLVKMRYSGAGTIGVLTFGPLYKMELDPVTPLFVDARSLVAYPDNASVDLRVYGNHLASQHMSYQWRLTGSGFALLQTSRTDRRLEAETAQDSMLRRILREVLPFGGVFIK